jgi:GcrA cell cycle regulator
MRSNSEWTNATIATLRQLWSEGHSTAEIGRRMGFSKNAVVGKAHRLDLPGRPTPIRRDQSGSTTARPRTPRRSHGPTLPALTSLARPPNTGTVVVPPSAPSQTRPPPPAPAKRTETNAKHRCCWPIGEPGTRSFRFCDAESVRGKPYCEEHAQLAYRAARKDLEAIAVQYN